MLVCGAILLKESGLLRCVISSSEFWRRSDLIRVKEFLYRNFFQSVILQEKEIKIHEMFANSMMSTLLKVFFEKDTYLF